MKNVFEVVIMILIFVSCKSEKKDATIENQSEVTSSIAPMSDEIMETAIIYEANIRQYSPEGTFDAFTKDIPQLKQLGVKIIWLMPVFPISETKRKAFGDKFASDIEDPEERKKYLGSYYAVTDFTKINPEFGTIENFRELVKTAHNNGIYVILDWVPNHTGWDHEWLKTNPEYFTQNDKGEVVHPEGTDWTDVADLNYDNLEMRKEMIEDMTYWIAQEGVDGFRCDVAGSVPIDFWEAAIPQLRSEKDIFMLAEAWEPELLKGELFDMAYAWDGHHLFNGLAKGEKTLKDFNEYNEKIGKQYEADDILMNFVTNHDENSWNGALNERMGKASELMTALSYAIKGMPLIYSGQEYNLDHRLKFFEKDSIPKTKGSMWSLLEKLGNLKTSSSALHGGKNAAAMNIEDTGNDHVLKFNRSKNGVKLTFIGNLSNVVQTFKMEGQGLDAITNEKLEFTGNLSLQPYEYKILID